MCIIFMNILPIESIDRTQQYTVPDRSKCTVIKILCAPLQPNRKTHLNPKRINTLINYTFVCNTYTFVCVCDF